MLPFCLATVNVIKKTFLHPIILYRPLFSKREMHPDAIFGETPLLGHIPVWGAAHVVNRVAYIARTFFRR